MHKELTYYIKAQHMRPMHKADIYLEYNNA